MCQQVSKAVSNVWRKIIKKELTKKKPPTSVSDPNCYPTSFAHWLESRGTGWAGGGAGGGGPFKFRRADWLLKKTKIINTWFHVSFSVICDLAEKLD